MFPYFPHNPETIKEMLKKIGINDVNELFNDIPSEVLLDDNKLDKLDNALSELELSKKVEKIIKKNKSLSCFRGGGAVDCYTPAVIDTLTSRQEFLTSYTPYQAEISQGTLQYIFEYQTLICELTQMDVANASMYDGATSVCEAALMACAQTKRSKILVSDTLNPLYKEALETYMFVKGIEIEYIDANDYVIDNDKVKNHLDSNCACVICQYPNYYGYIENYDFVSNIHENKSLFVLVGDISCQALITPFGSLGCDIACGEAQALGIPLSCGGPYLGFLACREKYQRKMPGRIVGMTKDQNENRCYVLTLQAREQHIRREKATSNICSNQSLMALHVTIYASLLGKKGLVDTQNLCYQNSHYLEEELLKTKLFNKATNNIFIKEFVTETNLNLSKLNHYLEDNGFLGGIIIDDNHYMLCVTETKTKEEIDEFVRKVVDFNESCN